ncbi:formylmethanofuran dehydrogenase subunit A [Planctellipticum variicoloris]|uniref:formylmethanofuran dehydrogenase subunit A n=1 Tax=Planctellipticum variicoloris TaxID=3064265 RepID=UPI0030134F38|nr:formylmethanofuran dehydrogenase subunit A [Planctomycetaceae bacterium SH412]
MTLLCLQGGNLYDPRHGIDGEVRDLWIEDGRIVATPADAARRADRTIDARGLVVMPGGVDMHCHIAGPKVNSARKMLPEDRRNGEVFPRRGRFRSGTIGSMPSTFATGYLYTGMGYTTAFDAAIPPLAARHVHEEFQDIPLLDKGFLVLMGNNHFAMRQIADKEPALLKAYMAWLLKSARGYGIKIVNPGGVENWKSGRLNVSSVDDDVAGFGITPRAILRELATACDELKLPHPVHIHGNNLGLPGNWSTTLETMQALEGRRGHLTHIQFHSYGGDAAEQATFCSKVPELAAYVNAHPNLSVDVGQVMFGKTTSMTGDGPLGYYLHRVTGGKWFSGDLELESGCGIVPIQYKQKSFVHALQWAIGLEWYLLVDDPWRIAMSTDHPNGASFLAYPEIIALLMDRGLRQDFLATLPEKLRTHCTLADLAREYTLNEIAIITRAAPARMLGLDRKGHLGIGADADVTVYSPQDDRQRMFELPRYVIKSGEVVLDDGELRDDPPGRTLHVESAYDHDIEPHIARWFADYSTVQFANYPVQDHELGPNELLEVDASSPSPSA